MNRIKLLQISLLYSIALHFAGGMALYFASDLSPKKKEDYQKVKIAILEKPKEEAKPTIPPKPAEEAPKKIPPKPKDLPTVSTLNPKPPDSKPTEPVKPVQGFRPDTMSESATGIAVPIGNTLMIDDKGLRLKADEVKEIKADLSSFAKLIADSFVIPEYTAEALDANVEGSYIVDVYIDATGNVLDATLRKKVGYGMDERIVKAAKSAKFIPRKNSAGGAIAGWSELKFTLQIP